MLGEREDAISRLNMNISYTENASSEGQIMGHLEQCDDRFVPSLSSRVNIQAYSRRLFRNAYRIEAWCENSLVGLLAFYIDAPAPGAGYISNVSVDANLGSQGIASTLIRTCICRAEANGLSQLHLQVDHRNQPVQRLYEKHGFKVVISELTAFPASHMTLNIQKLDFT